MTVTVNSKIAGGGGGSVDSIADVPGLQAELDDKLSISSATTVAAKATPIVTADRFLIKDSEAADVPAEVSPAQVALSVGATPERLSAIDAEIAEVALGSKRVFNKTTAVHYVFGAYATMLDDLRKLSPKFGTSTPDTQYAGGIVTTTEYWYDPVNGNDANNGSTLALAKRTIPNPLYAGAGRKTLLPSGYTLPPSQSVQFGADNSILSVWQADNTKPRYGEEITWHRNPFTRALAGGWLTEEEESEYGIFDGQILPSNNSSLRGFSGTHTSAIKTCVRGFIFKNYSYAAIGATNNCDLRVEDCVIEDILRDPGAGNSYYGGVGIRCDGATSRLNIARCFLQRIGEDVFWAAAGSTLHKFSDLAIKHTCDKQLYGGQHSDVIQFAGGYPGAFEFRRTVVALINAVGPLLNNGNGETASGGAVLMSSNGGTASSGGLIEDVIMLSTFMHTYLHDQPGVQIRRVVALNVGRGAANPGTTGMAWNQQVALQEDCVYASYNTTFPSYGPQSGVWCEAKTLINLGRLDS